MQKRLSREGIFSCLWIILGSAIYCVGFNWFFEPNQIAFGGLTGVGQVINAVVPVLPIGTIVLAMNLPLFYFGWKHLGGKVLVSSLFAMFLTTIGLDVLTALHTFAPMEDKMLAALFGGAFIGLALGIIFSKGATTGGTDLAARLVKLKLAWLPLGKVLMLLDLLVVAICAIAFGEMDSALYGVVALVVSTYLTDMVLYGMDTSKVAYIISDRHEELIRSISRSMDRGVTILHGEGAWSGEKKEVLMCAFRQREIVTLKELVKEADPQAFLIVCNTHEVLGDGFRSHDQENI